MFEKRLTSFIITLINNIENVVYRFSETILHENYLDENTG